MGKVTLSLVVLKTRQVDSLRKFYGTLGIELIEEKHGKGPVHYSGRIGELLLEVYPLPVDDTLTDSTTRLGFVVENVIEVTEALQTIGTLLVAKPQATDWGYRAVVRDPDGRAVELYQR